MLREVRWFAQGHTASLIVLYTSLPRQSGKRRRCSVCDEDQVILQLDHQPTWSLRFQASVLNSAGTLESPRGEL